MKRPTIGPPRLLNVNREPHRPKKRKKVTLVFDEQERRRFLTGFHRRKVKRREEAQEELKVKLKEEKKRIRSEARDKFKSLVSSRDIPELEEFLSKEYEDSGKTVSILELNVNDLVEGSTILGENKPAYEDEEESEAEEDDESVTEAVPGMALTAKPSKKSTPATVDKPLVQKKALSKAIQKAASRSKVYHQKMVSDRRKNKKNSAREKKRKERIPKGAKLRTKQKITRRNAK